MSYEFNTGMKVFSRLYVGYQEQGKGQVPLGFATPYEENAAGRKRQETVDNWSKGWHEKKPKIAPKIIDNELATGFKITDDIKRVYYGGGNVVFRVEDPRGFELEIQSQNLMTLISLVGLNAGGEVPGKCCWGRDEGKNILIHESSEEFKKARLAAETIKPLAGIKAEFKRGDILILTSAKKVQYLGRFWLSGYDSGSDENGPKYQFTSPNIKVNGGKLPGSNLGTYTIVAPKQFHVVQDLSGEKSVVQIYRDIKVVAVEKSVEAETSVKDALKFINSRTRIVSASAADMTTWLCAADHKRPLVWKKELITEAAKNKIVSRIKRDNKDRHGGGDFYDYLSRSDGLNPPLQFVVELNGELWNPQWHDIRDEGHAYDKNKQTLTLINFDEKKIHVTGLETRDAHHYKSSYAFHYSNHLIPLEGEVKEIPIITKPPKNNLTEPLEAWYQKGIVYTLNPVYEGEQ